jgi:hypothetical protein
MAATPEAKVKAKVKAYLRERGVWFCMPMGTGFGSSGVPDFICCHNGKLIGIETKAPGKLKNTTPLQDMQIEAIRESGGIAVVVDDVRQLEGVI